RPASRVAGATAAGPARPAGPCPCPCARNDLRQAAGRQRGQRSRRQQRPVAAAGKYGMLTGTRRKPEYQYAMARTALPPRWWLTPLLYAVAALTGGVAVLVFSATAREVVGRAFSMLVGALATPFILETATAIAGLVIVITIN